VPESAPPVPAFVPPLPKVDPPVPPDELPPEQAVRSSAPAKAVTRTFALRASRIGILRGEFAKGISLSPSELRNRPIGP
jgi:hypothetical protein